MTVKCICMSEGQRFQGKLSFMDYNIFTICVWMVAMVVKYVPVLTGAVSDYKAKQLL